MFSEKKKLEIYATIYNKLSSKKTKSLGKYIKVITGVKNKRQKSSAGYNLLRRLTKIL